MKTKIYTSILLLLSVYISGNAQHTAITTTSKAISNNLDLEAVAYLFGKSHNLEHFEEEINSPKNAISNLDLNRDGYVDYLRVVETNMQNVHTVNIQAVLGNDLYKDIATIGVQKDHHGKTYVRMIGNEKLYGYNYVINPRYVNRPVIVANFWKPNHKAYHVSYGNHYPVHYTPRVVCTTHVNKKHLNYYATAYYNTNRPAANHHYSAKHQHNNYSKDFKQSNKYKQGTSHSYSGKQTHNSHTKANKQSNNQNQSTKAKQNSKQNYSTTPKYNTRQSNSTVRYTNNTQKQVNTRNNTTGVKTASTRSSQATSTRNNTSTVKSTTNSRSKANTQQSRSTRSQIAMR